MGLDMYLTEEIYIGAEYEHRNVNGTIDITIEDKPIKIDFKKVSTITQAIGYWRKSNQIHNWFVTNIQEGIDECQKTWVSLEQLQELKDTCKKVLDNKELAKELLPCQAGFFFGSTEYDERYYQDLKETIKIIESIDTSNTNSFYYQASW